MLMVSLWAPFGLDAHAQTRDSRYEDSRYEDSQYEDSRYEDYQADNSDAIYQAYQQQLQENRHRSSYNRSAYDRQLHRNQTAQTYLPPVHIAPQFPNSRPNPHRTESRNGRFNSVQNYARPSNPAYAKLSDDRRTAAQPTPARKPRASAQARHASNPSREPAQTEHVYLQDRLASAISRKLNRPDLLKPNDQVTFAPNLRIAAPDPTTAQVAQQKSTPQLKSTPQPEPKPYREFAPQPTTQLAAFEPQSFPYTPGQSEITPSRQAAEEFLDDRYASSDVTPEKLTAQKYDTADPGDHAATNHDRFAPALTATQDYPQKRSVLEREFEVGLASTPTTYSYPQVAVAEDDSHVVPSSLQSQPRRSAKPSLPESRRAKQPAHNFNTSVPDRIPPQRNRLRKNRSAVRVAQEASDSDGPKLPALYSDSNDQRSSDPRFKRGGSQSKNDPTDDFDPIDDSTDLNKDRIRSRLDDDFDDLEDIDDDSPDLGDDEPAINRPRVRPCNEFRDELLATSIRDISLDVSPRAQSEEARYGGPTRQWTDRSGNVIGQGQMVDLRRGYVLLDSGQKLPYAKLGIEDLAAVSEFWRIPTVCLLGNRGGSPYRSWTPQTVTWTASALCHKPLYFENRQLERYGHSRGPFAQPIHSTLHFFTSLVSVPYQSAINPPNECQYALGFFRPGDCAPWLKDPIPISLEGIRRQALFTTGAAFYP